MEWQSKFQERILVRGYNYYLSGAVEDLKVYDDHIESIVEGTEEYEVVIDIENDEVISMYCSCPYAQDGHLCKHMAATLYEYTQEECEAEEYQDEYYDDYDYENVDIYDEVYGYRDSQTVDDITLNLLKEAIDIEKLRFLAQEVLKRDPSYKSMYKDVLETSLIELSQTSYMNDARKLIRNPDKEQELNEYIHRMISLYIDHNELEKGTVFLQWLIDTMAYEMNCSFDFLSQEIKHFLEKLEKNHKENMLIYLLNRVEKRDEIMDIIVQSFNNMEYVDVFRNEMNLWTKEIEYNIYPALKQRAENFVSLFLKLAYEKGLNEQILDAMIQNHQNLDCIKHWQIKRFMDKEQYSKARELLEEGLKTCQEYGSRKRYRLLYKELLVNQKDIETLKVFLRELIKSYRDIETYRELKNLYSKEEFREVRFEIFSEFSYDDFLLKLYVEEQKWKSLLKNLSMRSDLNFLNMYEKQIPQEFEADIVQVYKEILEKNAQLAANRNVYKEWVNTMIHMMEYDTGSQVVREMLYHWSRLYSSRRAMQEELQVVYQALSDE